MKGHPPWPSVVCDEEMLPHSLLTSRPVTARLPDGTFRKPEYADGGKRAHERTFPIMFLHTNEFAWMPNTELTPLDPEDESVKAPPEKGKSKTLLAAYAKATEANDLQHFKTMLVEHQKALQQDIEEREALAAEKAAAKSKKSRKNSGAVADDGDEMDVDNDEAAEKPKSKKRKKADDSDADEKVSESMQSHMSVFTDQPSLRRHQRLGLSSSSLLLRHHQRRPLLRRSLHRSPRRKPLEAVVRMIQLPPRLKRNLSLQSKRERSRSAKYSITVTSSSEVFSHGTLPRKKTR